MRCYIIDDMQFCIDQIARHILKTPGYSLAGSETDSTKALNYFLSGMVQADLIFLDIDMPGINGLDFEKQVGGLAYIVFVSGHRQYAVEAFESDAKAYLLKPVSYEKFLTAVEKISKLNRQESVFIKEPDTEFMVKVNGKNHLKKVVFDTIVYIQAADNYMALHLKDGTSLMVNITMKKLLETLPAKHFLRIHHSYAVNKNYVTRILGNTIKMIDDISLDISRAYKKEVTQSFKSI